MDKQCKKCLKTKPLDEFYRHPQMADGLLNKCKECTKADVNENRDANRSYYRNYARKRYDSGVRPPPANPQKRNGYSRAWGKRNREKRYANAVVARAIQNGRLVRPSRCSECNKHSNIIEAHHKDHSRPLEVTWLCSGCHGETRKKDRKELQPRKRGGYKGRMVASRA